MKLIVGLGNPGQQHEHTRHNVGFVVLDRLARRYAAGEIARSKFHSAMLDGHINGQRVLLLKPTTFMNRSGQSVAEAIQFYRLDPGSNLMVVVDDVALGCGIIRLRSGGGAGGHNGLADIELKLATQEYSRLRIGIDAPGDIPQSNYVLGRFRPDQQELVEPALETAVDAAACWALHGIDEAMNRFNHRNTG